VELIVNLPGESMQTAVMTDTECIENLQAIYGSEFQALDENTKLEAIAILATSIQLHFFGSTSLESIPIELLAHMRHLSPKGMRTLINVLNCAPRHV
jgi:hypothetical protein